MIHSVISARWSESIGIKCKRFPFSSSLLFFFLFFSFFFSLFSFFFFPFFLFSCFTSIYNPLGYDRQATPVTFTFILQIPHHRIRNTSFSLPLSIYFPNPPCPAHRATHAYLDSATQMYATALDQPLLPPHGMPIC